MDLGFTVPWLRGNPEPFLGPFRDNIAELLRLYGTRINLGRCIKKINAWIVPLHATNGCEVLLHVYEERISEDKDAISSCDCCRNMGKSKNSLAAFQPIHRVNVLFNPRMAKPPSGQQEVPLHLARGRGAWRSLTGNPPCAMPHMYHYR